MVKIIDAVIDNRGNLRASERRLSSSAVRTGNSRQVPKPRGGKRRDGDIENDGAVGGGTSNQVSQC